MSIDSMQGLTLQQAGECFGSLVLSQGRGYTRGQALMPLLRKSNPAWDRPVISIVWQLPNWIPKWPCWVDFFRRRWQRHGLGGALWQPSNYRSMRKTKLILRQYLSQRHRTPNPGTDSSCICISLMAFRWRKEYSLKQIFSHSSQVFISGNLLFNRSVLSKTAKEPCGILKGGRHFLWWKLYGGNESWDQFIWCKWPPVHEGFCYDKCFGLQDATRHALSLSLWFCCSRLTQPPL